MAKTKTKSKAKAPKKAAKPKAAKAPKAAKVVAPKPMKPGKPITGAKVLSVRKKLLEMRADLSRAVRRQAEVEQTDNGDSVDQAQLSIEKELLFELTGNERGTLDQIEAALRKIEKGTYGLCESCQQTIAKPRLDALPFARYCISCQNSSESVTDMTPDGPDFRGMDEGTTKDPNA